MKNPATAGVVPNAEMELLCACISPIRSAEIADGPFWNRPIDWPKFLSLATNHHVVPRAYKALKSAAAKMDCIPSEWLAQLRSRHMSIAAYNLRALASLYRLQQLMEAHRIQLVPIKGPALAIMAYEDVAWRQFEDLDFIVRREDLLRAVDLLEQDGYRLRELSSRVCRARYLESLQNWSFHKPGSAPLDLKPVLVSHTLSRPRDVPFMASACRHRIPIDEKRSVTAPEPGAMLLAVCMDGANEMWFKLSSVADVGALLATYADLDWRRFLEDAARLGQKRSMLVGACLAEDLLGAILPSAFIDGERRDPLARRLARQAAQRLRTQAPRHEFIARQSWFAFRTRERTSDRWRFWSRLLFLPGAYEFEALPLPGALYFCRSLVRPFRLAWDVLGRGGRHRRLTLRPSDGRVPERAKDA